MILNAGYEPLKIVSWQKAFILWFQGKVDVVEYYPDSVHSATQSFQLPCVLKLRKYVRPFFSVKLNRHNIFLRDGFQCQYCSVRLSEKKLTIDHVHPLSRGGGHHWQNVVAACSRCNSKKGAKTPEEAQMPLLKRPIQPRSLPAEPWQKGQNLVPNQWRDYLYAS